MQDEHREAIRRNISSLVNQTDLEIMCSALDEKGIFTEHNMETYRDSSSTQMHRKRCMYNDIMRRGPLAFHVLLETLEENGYWELVRMLDPNSILNTTSNANTRLHHTDEKESNYISLSSMNKAKRELQNNQLAFHSGGKTTSPATAALPTLAAADYDNNNELEPLVVTKSVKFVDDNHINHELGVYRTRGKHRGVLFMFTYIRFDRDVEKYRAGADVDSTRLQHLFDEIGFQVHDYQDLTYQETVSTLEKVASMVERPVPECVFVVVSSHGYERPGSSDNDIRCSDGKLIPLRQIIGHFSNVHLPALCDVPKVFIFSICRGENMDYVRSSPPPPPPHLHPPAPAPAVETDGTLRRHPVSPPLDKNMALHTNTLVVQATLPGFVSRRDPAKGSWYIQALCKTFAERAHDCDVDTLFTLVDERLKETFQIQTSSVDRWGFNRRLYLHPGLFE